MIEADFWMNHYADQQKAGVVEMETEGFDLAAEMERIEAEGESQSDPATSDPAASAGGGFVGELPPDDNDMEPLP